MPPQSSRRRFELARVASSACHGGVLLEPHALRRLADSGPVDGELADTRSQDPTKKRASMAESVTRSLGPSGSVTISAK